MLNIALSAVSDGDADLGECVETLLCRSEVEKINKYTALYKYVRFIYVYIRSKLCHYVYYHEVSRYVISVWFE